MEQFVKRHIGISAEDQKVMLAEIGVPSVEALIEQTIPAAVRTGKRLALDAPLSENAYLQKIKALAEKNRTLRSLIGMGFYGAVTPAVILRNIFENPAWYTSYTPYQAEISQGRLEALLNFQTMVCSLTGMEISNCSLLDEASAAAEAARTMFDLRSRDAVKEGRNVLFADKNIFPSTLAVVRTRCAPLGIEVRLIDAAACPDDPKCFGAIVQYPCANGEVRDYAPLAERLHGAGALLTAVCDLLSLTLLREPAAFGADIAVGTSQRIGTPLAFGGPHAAYMACRKQYVRSMPGRIIGVSVDRCGKRALRMALQTREQHIKREKASSNICTAQALMAIMSGMTAVYHGAEGLLGIAQNIRRCAANLAAALAAKGYTLAAKDFFDTIEVQGVEAAAIRAKAEAAGFNFYYPNSSSVRISLDELTDDSETAAVAAVFGASVASAAAPAFADEVRRKSVFLQESVFNRYRSETELMRYIKQLELRDISLANSMIPLGSCTMKLNAAAEMLPLSWNSFANIHPMVPRSQAAGYYEMIDDLKRDISAITGFEAVSLQPNSGASGEYAGLMIIRRYHDSRDDTQRRAVLIPASAHGTNPASASMAGMSVITVACDSSGNIDIADLEKKAADNADRLACIMITYPSTHGVFEEDIIRITDAVHRNGGLVYMDGANMNAQVGYTNPAAMHADVCHLNFHKTFAMPHGGGGPGAGAVCAAEHLAAFLPAETFAEDGGECFAVASSPFGNAYLLPITCGYIKMMGADGLQQATAAAILNANYIAKRLSQHFGVLYTGRNGRVAHECIIDCRQFMAEYGVGAGDIARRLMDYGFHAPTVSFPVHETLMIEPTESESRQELDRFADAMISIKDECGRIRRGEWARDNNPLVMAPHTAAELCAEEWNHPYSRQTAVFPLPYIEEKKFFPYVSKIDHGYGDRNLTAINDQSYD